MRWEEDRYEFPVEWRDWCTGAGQPATMLWFAGRTWLAGVGSRAEEALLERGAVPVATLRFDADPCETVHAHGTVTRLGMAQALARFRSA